MAKILVIEDDKFLRKVIEKKLLGEGHKIVEALDGESGVQAAQEQNPDLILLDLVLPEMDGFETLKRIKKDKKTFKIPVIILSNLGEKENINKGLKLGAVDYLIKAKLDPGQIMARVQVVLERQKK